jgi:hypothetical protein
MPTTNFDASLTTARRRQLANYGWRLNDQYSYNPQTLNPEQAPSHGSRGTGPSAEVLLSVYQGAILAGQPNVNVNPSSTVTAPCTQSGNCPATVTLQGFVRNSPANSRSLGGSQGGSTN